jgi:hypothetical protein
MAGRATEPSQATQPPRKPAARPWVSRGIWARALEMLTRAPSSANTRAIRTVIPPEKPAQQAAHGSQAGGVAGGKQPAGADGARHHCHHQAEQREAALQVGHQRGRVVVSLLMLNF